MKMFCLACCVLLSYGLCAQNDTAFTVYTGKYTTKEGSKISVYIESGKLVISGDKGTAPLVREKTDSFSIEGYTGVGYVKFTRGKDPAVVNGVHVYLEDMNIDVIAGKDSAAPTSSIRLKDAKEVVCTTKRAVSLHGESTNKVLPSFMDKQYYCIRAANGAI